MVVVVGEDVLQRVKSEGELSGRGKCPGDEHVRGGMSGGRTVRIPLNLRQFY